MVWVFVAIGVFLFLGAAMYVPDWIRFIKWNRRRKRLPESKANRLQPPVGIPFWSSYAGGQYGGAHLGGGGGGVDCGPDTGGFGGGGFDGGGFDGGGDGGGGCD